VPDFPATHQGNFGSVAGRGGTPGQAATPPRWAGAVAGLPHACPATFLARLRRRLERRGSYRWRANLLQRP
jgi:hypothetical protein